MYNFASWIHRLPGFNSSGLSSPVSHRVTLASGGAVVKMNKVGHGPVVGSQEGAFYLVITSVKVFRKHDINRMWNIGYYRI